MPQHIFDKLDLPISGSGGTSSVSFVNNPKSVAAQFSASVGYTKGQLVYYDNALYRFTADHAAGAWNSGHVTAVTVAGELKAAQEEFSDLKEELSATDTANDYQVYIPCDDSPTFGDTYTTIKKSGKVLQLSNGAPASTLTRLCIYGTFAMSGGAPSYANRPAWYNDPLNNFVIGHKYKFDYTLVSGTIDKTGVDTELYFDLRTKNGDIKQVFSTDKIWTCTFKPEMIAFVLRQFSYDDAVVYMSVIDLTAMEANDPLTERVEALEEKTNLYDIPSYFESQLSTAISKINTDINSNKTYGTYGTDIESFVFITDVHWSANKKHSPALIKSIMESTPIRTVICGGDFIQSSNATKAGAVAEIRDFTNAITAIPVYEYFCVFGNHDDNSNSGASIDVQFTKTEQFNLLYSAFADKPNVHWIWEEMPNILSETSVKNDYYIDHARTKTRFLCLDWNNPMSGNRATWIQSVLAKDDGYRIIVIYHGIYSGSGGVLTPEHTTIMTLIEPYKAKVVALFTGHAHMDSVQDYYGDGSVPVILTSCDTFRTGMTEGTVTEQCFDVCVIDYGQSKIKLTRIGNGSDREVNISVS